MKIKELRMHIKEKTFISNNTLDLKFSVKAESRCFLSKKIVVGGLVVCQFRADVNVIYISSSNMPRKITLSEKFRLLDEDTPVNLTIRSNCFGVNSVTDPNDDSIKVAQEISNDIFTPANDNIWHYKGTITANEQKTEYDVSFTITIEDLSLQPSAFDILHEDTSITDFELSGQNGSINVHKAVLAASSPMLNTMLSGQWKESTKGKIELAGITKETLTDLKTYMYLRKLPHRPDNQKEIDKMHTQLEELLKIACYLLMSDLVQACCAQFLLDLTTENAYKLLSLAGVYKLKSLMKGVLLSYHHGSIDIVENSKFPGDWI